jgi:hypothetical protein
MWYEMGGTLPLKGERRNALEILVRKAEAKRSLGRPRRSWEDNINIEFEGIGCEGVDRIQLTQDRFQWLNVKVAARWVKG